MHIEHKNEIEKRKERFTMMAGLIGKLWGRSVRRIETGKARSDHGR